MRIPKRFPYPVHRHSSASQLPGGVKCLLERPVYHYHVGACRHKGEGCRPCSASCAQHNRPFVGRVEADAPEGRGYALNIGIVADERALLLHHCVY